jgi:hypothetical protein
MPRLWLVLFGAAAVIACGDDSSGNGPDQLFPDVAGVYTIQGEFDAIPPEDASFTGTVTIQQESLESSLLTGSADITVTGNAANLVITDAELQDASVDLAGVVTFTVEDPAEDVIWTFSGERGGDVLEGRHTLTQGSNSQLGDWSGSR